MDAERTRCTPPSVFRISKADTGSAEPINELARRDDLEREMVRVDREQVEIAGDDRVSTGGRRERDEVVVVGIAANRRVRTGGSAIKVD